MTNNQQRGYVKGFILIMTSVFVGFAVGAMNTPNQNVSAEVRKIEKGDRFTIVYKQENNDTIAQVIQDTETGKKYFYFQYYQSAGLVEIK